MYLEIPQGKSINIQGLECKIPPVGYVYNIVTSKLEEREIYKRSSISEEQYWERIPLPVWYKDTIKRWEAYDRKKKEDDPEFYDAQLEEFKAQEWDRRLNGFWFMNKGEATYITGMHYLFMQWWVIDIGYPKFRIIDLEYFYFLQYVIEDPNCYGMLEICKRRNGKTYRAGVFIYEYITRTKQTNAGIQSKTGPDAKKLFGKAVVGPFKKLPKFFRPEYDMSLGVTPKTEIRFQQTNIRGKKAEDYLEREELNSLIDFQSADVMAYDGQKVHRKFDDEFCKTVECNIYERHEVTRFCLVDDEGNIIGKVLYSSTVEKLKTDREGVQEGAKLLWDESNQLDIQENGQTKSGCYRFFIGAHRSRNIDIYGFADEEKSRRQILANWEAVKNNRQAYSARRRKEPLTIGDAFGIDADTCIFNGENIEKRSNELLEKPIHKRKYIYYRDNLDSKVKWRDVVPSDGDFYWRGTPDLDLNIKEKTYEYDGSAKYPTRTEHGAISVDSYSNSQGGRKYGSKASAFIGDRKLFKAVSHLYGRPKVKDDLHNQVMLAAEFHGYLAYYEHTADDYEGYFRERGKIRYLGKYPFILIDPVKIKQAREQNKEVERHYGTPLTPYSLTQQHDNGIAYFEHHCHCIDFEEVLIMAPKFDPYNRTECDAIVSLLILISVLMEPIRKPQQPKEALVQSFVNPHYKGNFSAN